MHKLAPICLFVYNRFNETKLTIGSLKNNFLAQQSDLIIFSDGIKNESNFDAVMDVRRFIKSITGFKSIIIYESDLNKGLAQSIIDGVTLVLNQYDKIIVLEDDLITTPNFLDFMNQGLDYFNNNTRIYSINGYSPYIGKVNSDSFLHARSFPWGWGTWRKQWDKDIFQETKFKKSMTTDLLNQFSVDCGEDAKRMLLDSLKGQNDSWYIKWVYNNYVQDNLSVFPIYSKIINIGFTSLDNTHCKYISAYEHRLDIYNCTNFTFKNIYSLQKDDRRFLKYFTKKHKLKYRLRLMFKKGGLLLLFNELKNRFL